MAQKAAAFRLGVYTGSARDVTCPGDNITYEVILHDPKKCTVESIPQLSYFKGGQPPFHLEGTWELDDPDLVITVTKQDVTGPKKDADIRLPIGADGRLSFRGTWCSWRANPPEDDKIKAEKAELEKFAAETKRRHAELEALREEQMAAKRAEEEEIERLRNEVKRQREEQEAEARQAEAERARLEEERREQEAQAARQRAELDALAKAREEVQRNREEARRLQEEHQKELAEQQTRLEAERLKVEEERAAREAEKAAKQAELDAQKEEVQRQRQEVECQRAEEEELRKAQADQFKYFDEELKGRAEDLIRTEQALSQERQQLLKSRTSLAMVQAHVVASMMGKTGQAEEVNIDVCDDEPEAEEAPDRLDADEEKRTPTGADVWNMDWSTVEVAEKSAAAAPS
uniref:Uncharacterized protein n=1 Tax=Alexandrium monilatum TaxID=311494 RepID=A0A7S4PZC9_9DINO